MLSLIASVVFGIVVAIFAVQNRGFVDIHFGGYGISGVPLYLLVLGTVLVTIIFAAILYFVHSVSSSFALMGKSSSLRKMYDENKRLTSKVKDLEVENARLKGQEQTTVRKPVFTS